MFAQSQGKLKKPLPSQDKGQDDFNQDLHKQVTQVMIGLNKNIGYGNGTNTDENQNLDGYHSGLIVAPAAPNTQFTVAHTLGRIPIGFHTVVRDNGGTCYGSNIGAWSTTQIFCKDSSASTQLRLFIF
jgi:hypothetical protein